MPQRPLQICSLTSMVFVPTTDAQLFHKLQRPRKVLLHDTIMIALHHPKLLRPSIWIFHVHEPLRPTAPMNRLSQPILQYYPQSHALLHKVYQREQRKKMFGVRKKSVHLRNSNCVLDNKPNRSHKYRYRGIAPLLQWHRKIARIEHLEAP